MGQCGRSSQQSHLRYETLTSAALYLYDVVTHQIPRDHATLDKLEIKRPYTQ